LNDLASVVAHLKEAYRPGADLISPAHART
jgi:hypothetical protein